MSTHHLPDISAESLSCQLSGSLPVYVSPEDVNKQPQVCNLLEDLSHRLTPTGVHKTTHTHLAQATHAMIHAREKFLEGATLHRLTTDVLRGAVGDDTIDQKTRKIVLNALTLSELQDHLSLVDLGLGGNGSNQDHEFDSVGSVKKLTVFGLTAEDVGSCSGQLSGVQLKQVAAAVEKQLEKEWTKILSFIDPVGFLSYEPESVLKTVAELSGTKQRLGEERTRLTHTTVQTDCLSQKVYGQLVEYSKILQGLMSKHRLSQYAAQHLAISFVKLNAYVLKLRCLQLEILVDTYTSQSVSALRGLEGHLSQRSQAANTTLTQLHHTLRSYSAIDPRFQHLLQEYGKLREDIEFAKLTMPENSA